MSNRDNHQLEPGPDPDEQQIVVASRVTQMNCESLIHTIVTGVSKATGKDPTETPPLYNTIDVDALADLFGPQSTDSNRVPSDTVTFQYEGCIVTVSADGEVIVKRAE